jgi:hypothetical protein
VSESSVRRNMGTAPCVITEAGDEFVLFIFSANVLFWLGDISATVERVRAAHVP